MMVAIFIKLIDFIFCMTNRWVLLEHRLAKFNDQGFHFDLLIEDGSSCRTWRLPTIPIVDGPLVEALLLPPHNLTWLEKKESLVSGGRGWAKRVESGIFHGSLPLDSDQDVALALESKTISGLLEISGNHCRINTLNKINFI